MESEIAEPLLQYLRKALGDPRLSYGVRPSRISGGNETDIFGLQLSAAPKPFDRPLVARVFRAGGAAQRARLEAAAHRAVTEQGLAAPRVFFVGDQLDGVGGAFLIMERAAGRSAVELLRPSLLARLPSLLAGTMAALHRLDAGFLVAAAEAAGLDRRSVVLDLAAETRERRAAREFPSLAALGAWLDARRPDVLSSAINHGDLHPFNLMIHRGRVSSVLDWTRAVIAPPEYDIAANRIIVHYGPVVGPGSSRWLVPLYRRWFPRRFEAIYRTLLPFDETLVRYFEVHRALGILTDVALRRRAMAAHAAVPPDRDKSAKALDGPNFPRLVAHVERLSGLRVELPPPAGPDPESPGRARR